MLGKPHNTSWHALAGLVALGGYTLGALGGAIALHPDFGIANKKQPLRLAHKLMGRASTASALAAIVSGWYKLGGSISTAAIAAALAGLGYRLRLAGGKAGAQGSSGLPGI